MKLNSHVLRSTMVGALGGLFFGSDSPGGLGFAIVRRLR